MTRFRVTASVSSGANSDESVVQKMLAEKWPAVADVLCGVPAVDGAEESCPAYSITLFVEGPHLKFCLRRYKHADKAFGTISEPSKGLDGLEDALIRGDYEWVWKRASK